jgi:cytochrome c oxidase subunit 2
MPGSRIALALVAVGVPLALVLAVFLGLPGAAPPESATSSGQAINDVYRVVLAVTAFAFVLVEAILIALVVRFRRRADTPEDVEGPQIHGNTRIEIIWTVVTAGILLALAIFTFSKVPAVEANPEPGEDVLVVDVTAHQFYWQYEYPNGAISYDTLYLPVDRPVTLVIRSEDVAHAWWVPELTGKRDAIPGRTNKLNFRPRVVDTFDGVCGEFCGIQHAVMSTVVDVLPAGDFDAWLAEHAPPETPEGLALLGEGEWKASCAKCHGLSGQGDIGPPIAGNPILTDPAALARLLANGQNLPSIPGYMPPTGKGWTDVQIDALVAYVKSNPELAGAQDGR